VCALQKLKTRSTAAYQFAALGRNARRRIIIIPLAGILMMFFSLSQQKSTHSIPTIYFPPTSLPKTKDFCPFSHTGIAQPLMLFMRDRGNKRLVFDAAFLPHYAVESSSRLKNNYAPTVVLVPLDCMY